ncbi:Tomm34 [Symbiodinium sp. CCMP2592]|nr:Tomm34 [Symbiodinium sp. CCMP2592]
MGASAKLKNCKGALDDVEQLLPELAKAKASDKEALELREKILASGAQTSEEAEAKRSSPKAVGPFAAVDGLEGSTISDPRTMQEGRDAEAEESQRRPCSVSFADAGALWGLREAQLLVLRTASDDEEDEPVPAAKSSETPKATGTAEPFPDLKVEFTVTSLEEAKKTANTLFADGKTSDAERWFSKAIWVAEESGKMKEVPESLRSVLHSNRAFARLKLKQWSGVEDDCTKALSLNTGNAKALYRRAQARFELKQRQGALDDVEKLLPLLAPPSDKEARELREKILALPVEGEPPKKAEPKPSPKAAAEPPKTSSPKAAAPMPNGSSEPAPGFRRMEIVEASDDEDDEPAPVSNGSDSPKAKAPAEPYPDLHIEFTAAGLEKAKQQANGLFSAGNTSESERWFSKALWVAEESGQVKEVPDSLRAVLYSNRAFARLKLKLWPGVEEDCTKALALSPNNAKALYRRTQARFELKQRKGALEDVEKLLPLLASPSDKDALELRDKILALPSEEGEPKKAEAPKPSSPKAEAPKPSSPKAEAPKPSSPKAEPPKSSSPPKAAAPKPSSPSAPPAAGFRRMEIVEASDDEDEEPAPAWFTVQGVEKVQGWFSKAIWVAEESGKVKEAYIASGRTCSGLKQRQEALEDVEKLLPLLAAFSVLLFGCSMSGSTIGCMSSLLFESSLSLVLSHPVFLALIMHVIATACLVIRCTRSRTLSIMVVAASWQ